MPSGKIRSYSKSWEAPTYQHSRKKMDRSFFRLCNRFTSNEREKDSILTVIDKATRMVHLVPCKKSIFAVEIAKLLWDNIVKLHGVPKILYSDRVWESWS